MLDFHVECTDENWGPFQTVISHVDQYFAVFDASDVEFV